MSELQLKAVEAIQSELEVINNDITGLQSIAMLIDLGGKLSSYMAFTGEQLSVAKRVWRSETARAYESYVFSKMAVGQSISPSMANKYAEAKTGDHEANYQFIERVNKACTHILDFLRTAISALKNEQQSVNYQPS